MSKKRNRAEILILLLLAIIVSTFLMSCETTKTKIEYVLIEPPEVPIDSVFNVLERGDWDYAIEKIRSQGDGHSYIINILDNNIFVINLYFGEMTFGNAKNISVRIEGFGNVLSSMGYFIQVGQFQDVTINNLNLHMGLGQIDYDNPYISVRGVESILTFTGDTTVMGPLINGIEVSREGVFNLEDNASLIHFNLAVIVNQGGIFNMRDNTTIGGGDRAVEINSNGIFNMSGGIISLPHGSINPLNSRMVYLEIDTDSEEGNNQISNRSVYLGIITVNAYGRFRMLGGSITQCRLRYRPNSIRSIINVNGGEFSMRGGNISNNTGYDTRSAIVQVEGYGNFYFYAGTISSNSCFAIVNVHDGSFRRYNQSIIYGNEETGVPSDLANYGRTLNVQPGYEYDVYQLLPHIDGYEHYTYYSYPWPIPGNETFENPEMILPNIKYDYISPLKNISMNKEKNHE